MKNVKTGGGVVVNEFTEGKKLFSVYIELQLLFVFVFPLSWV